MGVPAPSVRRRAPTSARTPLRVGLPARWAASTPSTNAVDHHTPCRCCPARRPARHAPAESSKEARPWRSTARSMLATLSVLEPTSRDGPPWPPPSRNSLAPRASAERARGLYRIRPSTRAQVCERSASEQPPKRTVAHSCGATERPTTRGRLITRCGAVDRDTRPASHNSCGCCLVPLARGAPGGGRAGATGWPGTAASRARARAVVVAERARSPDAHASACARALGDASHAELRHAPLVTIRGGVGHSDRIPRERARFPSPPLANPTNPRPIKYKPLTLVNTMFPSSHPPRPPRAGVDRPPPRSALERSKARAARGWEGREGASLRTIGTRARTKWLRLVEERRRVFARPHARSAGAKASVAPAERSEGRREGVHVGQRRRAACHTRTSSRRGVVPFRFVPSSSAWPCSLPAAAAAAEAAAAEAAAVTCWASALARSDSASCRASCRRPARSTRAGSRVHGLLLLASGAVARPSACASLGLRQDWTLARITRARSRARESALAAAPSATERINRASRVLSRQRHRRAAVVRARAELVFGRLGRRKTSLLCATAALRRSREWPTSNPADSSRTQQRDNARRVAAAQ
eukprot:scaffold1054_cov366-Prasinococcus_capsulatus_cf.AAC.15